MMEESNHLSADERLSAENQFLKLKLMAEHGGQFYSVDDDKEIPTEIENQFLNNVIEFERQFSSGRTITVFEKIGSPQHFKSVSEIPEEEIEHAWESLYQHMAKHGVELSACSPRVTARELYRFTTEELFKHETDDIKIAGMMTGFIYDEFYPDHEYDNTRAATDDCMRAIFCKRPFEWTHHFAKQFQFNEYTVLSHDDFKAVINRFKDVYDEIELNDLNVESAGVLDNVCPVKGSYHVSVKLENEIIEYKGNWLVEFSYIGEWGYWYITHVKIEGINI
jgi:hypothetical protein